MKSCGCALISTLTPHLVDPSSPFTPMLHPGPHPDLDPDPTCDPNLAPTATINPDADSERELLSIFCCFAGQRLGVGQKQQRRDAQRDAGLPMLRSIRHRHRAAARWHHSATSRPSPRSVRPDHPRRASHSLRVPSAVSLNKWSGFRVGLRAKLKRPCSTKLLSWNADPAARKMRRLL